MWRVLSSRKEGIDKGTKELGDVISGYSPEIVSRIVTDHLEKVINSEAMCKSVDFFINAARHKEWDFFIDIGCHKAIVGKGQ